MGPKVTSIVCPAAIAEVILPVIVIVLRLVLGVHVMEYTWIPKTLTEQSERVEGTVTIEGYVIKKVLPAGMALMFVYTIV